MRFEWDSTKAEINRIKHGVAFEEATSVFDDPNAITLPDAEHSEREDRWLTIGYSLETRLLLVVSTHRHESIRIISARKATRNERKVYESHFGEIR